jgi:hypothetical protein
LFETRLNLKGIVIVKKGVVKGFVLKGVGQVGGLKNIILKNAHPFVLMPSRFSNQLHGAAVVLFLMIANLCLHAQTDEAADTAQVAEARALDIRTLSVEVNDTPISSPIWNPAHVRLSSNYIL